MMKSAVGISGIPKSLEPASPAAEVYIFLLVNDNPFFIVSRFCLQRETKGRKRYEWLGRTRKKDIDCVGHATGCLSVLVL